MSQLCFVCLLSDTYKHVVVLGDFNTYPDYEQPVQYLMGNTSDLHNSCQVNLNKMFKFPSSHLSDAWILKHSLNAPGYTFHNMVSIGV